MAPRSSFDRINAFLDEHQIRHVIDQTYSFNDVDKAFEHLARDASGKVVLNVF
ncbi:zinc-binding dehydrogenase [Pseudomonas putida]|nr:zinc-binding dehydrogenase [Pseudomonas putida]